jgi:hypothetical protein
VLGDGPERIPARSRLAADDKVMLASNQGG